MLVSGDASVCLPRLQEYGPHVSLDLIIYLYLIIIQDYSNQRTRQSVVTGIMSSHDYAVTLTLA